MGAEARRASSVGEARRGGPMKGDGRIYQRHVKSCTEPCPEDCGCSWTVSYYRNGEEKRETVRTEEQAKKLHKKRRKEIAAGTYFGPDEEKLAVSGLLDSLAS